MKHVTCALIILITLVFSNANAQSWAGLRTGYPLGVTLHYGVENGLAAGTDFRVSGNLRVRSSNVEFGVGVDALQTVSINDPFYVYVGGGPAVDFGNGGVLVDLHGLVGGEFRLSDIELNPFGIFAELSLGAGIGLGRDSIIPSFGGAVGFNYHF